MKKLLLGSVGVASIFAFGSPAWSQTCGTCPPPTTENYTYNETVPQQSWIVPAHTQVVPAYKIGGAPTGNLVSNCPLNNAPGGPYLGAAGLGAGLGSALYGAAGNVGNMYGVTAYGGGPVGIARSAPRVR